MSYPSELHDDEVLAGRDHELTLSTTAIFGIFFGLVALCAVFFGFGYSLGSHKSPSELPVETATSGNGSGANFSAFKPAAGQPAGSLTVHANPTPAPTTPSSPASAPAPTENAEAAASVAAPVVRVQPAQPAAPAVAHPTASSPQPTAAQPVPPGLFVQVAAIAVTHPDDATLMVNALRTKGYAASPHTAADNYIHVLVGPFANRPAAEAILKRLSTDGYTAYIR